VASLGTLVISNTITITIHEIFQEILTADKSQEEKYLSNLAKTARFFGYWISIRDPEKAIPIHMQGIKDAEKNEDYEAMANFTDLLAVSLASLGQYSQSLQHLKKVLEIHQKIYGENHFDTALSYVRVGLTLCELNQKEEASKYLQKALSIQGKLEDKKFVDLLYGPTALLRGLISLDFSTFSRSENSEPYNAKTLSRIRKESRKNIEKLSVSLAELGKSVRK
jgi:tetratricopeptide (TPR) repeat protein